MGGVHSNPRLSGMTEDITHEGLLASAVEVTYDGETVLSIRLDTGEREHEFFVLQVSNDEERNARSRRRATVICLEFVGRAVRIQQSMFLHPHLRIGAPEAGSGVLVEDATLLQIS